MENKKNDSGNDYKYIRISYNLTEDTPVHPDLAKITITPKNQIKEGDSYNTSVITAENHSGTHVDAPAHFLKNGRSIFTYDPNELTFKKPLIVDCPKKPDELIHEEDLSPTLKHYNVDNLDFDCILIRTGFGKYHDTDTLKYLTKNPGISPEAVFYLRSNLPKLACLAIDTVSMSRYGRMEEMIRVHQTAFSANDGLGKPLLFVEDLDIESIPTAGSLEEVMVIPWQVGGIDSAPCTVLVKIKSE
ncbi:cyclase family protein [Methanobacterium sp.]|uniref:cyclase family protein n=1 Tax=Methanobacterium sp. TaxID=2164 RepID=UPI002AB9EA89|nr:cyclase family protein [Methanobacterium sp.]MDY9924089.1 cyclase family protein [Methanobacterium sp.]